MNNKEEYVGKILSKRIERVVGKNGWSKDCDYGGKHLVTGHETFGSIYESIIRDGVSSIWIMQVMEGSLTVMVKNNLENDSWKVSLTEYDNPISIISNSGKKYLGKIYTVLNKTVNRFG